MQRFFLITSYETLSCDWLNDVLNKHPEISSWLGVVHDILASEKSSNFLELKGVYNNSKIDDMFIQASTHAPEKRLVGYVGAYTAYSVNDRMLREKTRQSLRKAAIISHPFLRLELCFQKLRKNTRKDSSYEMPLHGMAYYREYYNHIYDKNAQKSHNKKEVELFLAALTWMLDYDRLDLPTPTHNWCVEELLENANTFSEFIKYISSGAIKVDELYFKAVSPILKRVRSSFPESEEIYDSWQPWQRKLVEYGLRRQFNIPYYPHTSPPMMEYFIPYGYKFPFLIEKPKETEAAPFLLASFQLNSNRPAQFCAFMDNLQETADDPSCFEIIVNIDDDDAYMEQVIKEEQTLRPFTLKYIKTKRPPSFFDLWKPLNEIIKHTDPNAYFLINLADEQMYKTRGWDSILKRYVGFFPDHIFRLRTSRNKYRNYFDTWECGYAQDSVIVATKRWLEIGGDWNPCMGPDNFQQFIAFYLWKDGQFTGRQYQRDIPVSEITLADDSPGMGLDGAASLNRQFSAMKAWFIAQSPAMQQEAKHRAMKIKAHIVAHEKKLEKYEVIDNSKLYTIELKDGFRNIIIATYSYKVSWLKITLRNFYRRLFFDYYMGVPDRRKHHIISGTWFYLYSSKRWANALFLQLVCVKQTIRYIEEISKILFIEGKIKDAKVRKKVIKKLIKPATFINNYFKANIQKVFHYVLIILSRSTIFKNWYRKIRKLAFRFCNYLGYYKTRIRNILTYLFIRRGILESQTWPKICKVVKRKLSIS